MNCYFCNIPVTNGTIKNGKTLCLSCLQKLSIFTNQTELHGIYTCTNCNKDTMVGTISGINKLLNIDSNCVATIVANRTHRHCTNCNYHKVEKT